MTYQKDLKNFKAKLNTQLAWMKKSKYQQLENCPLSGQQWTSKSKPYA